MVNMISCRGLSLLFLLLQGLLAAHQLQLARGDVIYIEPQGDNAACPPDQSCQTLMQFVNTSASIMRSNVTLVMLSGTHSLGAPLSITQAATFTMVASYNVTSSPNVTCSGSGQLVLNEIQDVRVIGLTFIHCRGNTADSVDNLLLENLHFIGPGGSPQVTGTVSTGGAMNINGVRNLTVRGCTFTNNQVSRSSTSGMGGALAITAVDTLNITECTFQNNQVNGSEGNGGALFINVRDSRVAVTRCEFSNNQINDPRGKGGAVYISARNSTSIVSRTLFENNRLNDERGEGVPCTSTVKQTQSI